MLKLHKKTSFIDSLIRRLAITSIQGYQRYISPHKGYSCAHRLLWGGASCSEYVKQALIQENLTTAIKRSRKRFRDCRKANGILRIQKSESNGEENEGNNPENSEQTRDNSYNRNDRCTRNELDCACAACEVVSLLDFCNFW